jgi:hypothetical protein
VAVSKRGACRDCVVNIKNRAYSAKYRLDGIGGDDILCITQESLDYSVSTAGLRRMKRQWL